MNNVIAFPVQQNCFRCLHYSDRYCELFDEEVDSEIFAAKDCDGFEVASA